jgi:hypothetical protein
MIEEGLIDPHAVADMCLAYMSEDDVADMMRANDLLEEEDEDEEDSSSNYSNDSGILSCFLLIVFLHLSFFFAFLIYLFSFPVIFM